ncbi:MAG: hypothetical protein EOP45_03595 [Sphingobacteriaceae bacterium]|nr:MAG: hypothetical protein EOP45_03595 [Sphingobacteriaceae bacterium]
MTTKIDRETWTAVVNRTYEVEFDWIGIDRLGQIAVFSSFNKGFIPDKALLSFDKYKELDKLIDELPTITEAILCTRIKGDFKEWLSYSAKGLYGYDFQDAHREVRFGQYDLISKPEEPLTVTHIKTCDSVLQVVPFFDLVFGTYLSFNKLQLRENKN